MRLFLSAGEVSGDMYGAALARALQEAAPGIVLEGLGGNHMVGAGVRLLDDVTPCAAVGLLEQWSAVRPVARALRLAAKGLTDNRPDAVVLIDFQGANLKLAALARRLGIPTVYYILPQAWLWGFPGDARRIARAVDHLIAVFEPEEGVYAAAGARVTRVGHPLLDLVPGPPPGRPPSEAPVIALLPGSRRLEVERLAPVFLEAAERLQAAREGLRFQLPVASKDLMDTISRLARDRRLQLTFADPGDWGEATVALVASGTAVLEAAVRGVPCVAAYRVSRLTAWVARGLLHGRHVTLPNILLGCEVVPECLQADANPDRLAREVGLLLDEPDRRTRQCEAFARVRAALGAPGGTAEAAAVVLEAVERSRRGGLPQPAGAR